MNSIVFPEKEQKQLPVHSISDDIVSEVALADTVIERIAKLVVMKVPTRQIAMACGINPNKIADIIELPKIQAQIQIFTVDQIEEAEVVNLGWDAVESEAIGTVLEQLKKVPDADFALRAAALANKASRRGINHETIAGKTNTTAVIELSAVFIEKLQTMQIGMAAINVNARRIDTLDVQQTQHLFADTGKVSVDDLFGNGNITVEGELIDG